MAKLSLPSLEQINLARTKISPYIVRTPLIKLNIEGSNEIYLKLENLQPIGAFKIRPALNSLLSLPKKQLTKGVFTISSGNMALGLAWAANKLKVKMVGYVYLGAPEAKLSGIRELGGEIRYLPTETWWRCLYKDEELSTEETEIHTVLNNEVLAANGTIAMEILEDLPDVDEIYVPFGGGSCAVGIANAIQKLAANVTVSAVESSHGSPLAQSIAAKKPVRIETENTYIKSIGGDSVFAQIFTFVNQLSVKNTVVNIDKISQTIGLLFHKNKIITEGAGAASVAAAMENSNNHKKIVCVVTGGNIDDKDFIKILNGERP
ncbi:pyridoxal-phosphate dependent enzyme [Thalassotalea fonticola]|uniref:Pyridoxal-phosphate dependent enzyme n=1 Tax=Thalassotalea fonticola TaxID=3065649 RepID=A0ABZ0GKV0_9GAMM|nr:pyridoxal-phosphate dependent enzyme [Colwelliaceae bacterium S1-1]